MCASSSEPNAPPPRRRRRTAARGYLRAVLIPGLAASLVSACAAPDSPAHRRDSASAIAHAGGLQRVEFAAGPFTLTGFARGLDAGAELLAVYIEGDGRARLDKARVSLDPTPIDPVALRLAAQDPRPAVLYLARPCQYTPPTRSNACDPRYWSTQRTAEPVIAAMDAALDQAKGLAGASRLGLVGYSGGGAVALLLAARRRDVGGVVTVAGVLDYGSWTAHHKVDPLRQSLDPGDVAAALRDLPQVHLVGGDDETVPPLVAEAYRARLGDAPAARFVRIDGFNHHCCWAEAWPALLARHAAF